METQQFDYRELIIASRGCTQLRKPTVTEKIGTQAKSELLDVLRQRWPK
jgi:hypothetical protein